MSDTLPEREDQIANEEADERTFQRIRRARLIGNPNQNVDWCDDCHGYTHMPWCPSYKEPDTRRSGEMSHRTNHEQPANTHQPAARGGGDGQWEYGHYDGRAKGFYINNVPDVPSDYVRIADVTYHDEEGRREAEARARQIVTEHNQHQFLVAERELLREQYRVLIEAAKELVAMNNCNYDRDVMRSEGGFDALQKAVDAIEQRSTSE